MADPISVLSTEYRRWPVTATVGGFAVDPTDDDVFLAFVPTTAAPEDADFQAAEWVTEGEAFYVRMLIGPAGDLALDPGDYRVWLKLVDNPEVQVLPIDTLSVTSAFSSDLAGVGDLETYLRRTFSDDERSAAALILANVSGAARRAARYQRITLVTDDRVELTGVWGQTLYLPQRPVLAVSAVSLRDPAGVSIALTETRDFVWNRRGQLQRIGFIARIPRPIEGYWGGPAATVTVTYSHGYATVPDDVRQIVLAAAARELGNPEGDSAEAIGNYSVTHGATDVALLDSEMKALSNYGRVAQA